MLIIIFLSVLYGRCSYASASRTADFVIVGAGVSGCVLASQLCTRLPFARILLLERGSPRNEQAEFGVRAARNVFEVWSNSDVSEHLVSQGGPGVFNRSLIAVTARTFGGGSAINAGQFTMPPRGTISRWRLAGLSEQQVAHLLERVRHRIQPRAPRPNIRPSYTTEWLRAAESIGIKIDMMPLSPARLDHDSAFTSRIAFDNFGRRRDACSAYLPANITATCGSRLRIELDANVHKLLITSTKRAHGVLYATKNKKQTVAYARREVLLAAGPYGSPRILQQSGVGPTRVLQRAGVNVVHPAPVGVFAVARAAAPILSTYTAPLSNNNAAELYTAEARSQFASGQSGSYAITVGAANAQLRDLGEVTMVTGFPMTNALGPSLFNASYIRSTCILNPSRGTFSPLKITSSTPNAPLRLRFRALETYTDRRRMVTCLQRLRSLHKGLSKTMGAREVILGEGIDPSIFDDGGNQGDLALEKYARMVSQNAQHYVGGCAVHKVVDSTFHVKGLHGVRVVDSSVIPEMPPSAGPLASTYILAEHAAELIISHHNRLW